MKKITLLAVFTYAAILYSNAQNWMQDMHNPQVNFFTVQQEFNAWWTANGAEILSHPQGEEGESVETWKLFKRWEQDMLPMMTASGGIRLGPINNDEKSFYNRRLRHQYQRSIPTWNYIGTSMSFQDDGADSVTGRVNCVRFDPKNHQVIYCGAPSGGLWKSVDFGFHWQLLNTDFLPQIGVSDIAINPQNTNTIYIATGDIANSACLSIGILKSYNGGQTWDTTGLSFTTSQGRLIARVMISPTDTNTLYAATNTGIFKTTNGGNTWRQKTAVTNFTGMEFNPLNANTIYAWGNQLYRSVDSGATWARLNGGLPSAASSGGFGVALTPADTSCIYVLVSDSSIPALADLPYKGLYRSLDAGITFNRQSTSPDATGTQGSYDLAIGVSPVNKNMVIVGAVNMVYSKDGGVTWHGPNVPTHVDHHDIRFFNGSRDTVFSANDGGLFLSTDSGTTWKSLNNGMHIGQIYHVSSGSRTKYLYMSGRQDEGTLLQDTSFNKIVSTGDGLKCIIDPLNENHLLGSIEQGIIGTNYNGGQGGITILVWNFGTGVNGPGAWNTPYTLQNGSSDIIYIAKDRIYKSVDAGSTWATLHSPTLPANDNLYQLMVVAPSDPNYIYAATYSKLYRSIDGGATFTNINTGLNGTFTSLAVSESNPKEIWIGFSGNNANLLKSVDAGSHYTSFITGLPAGPFHPKSIASVKDSKDALYLSLGNAGGVYYRDSTLNSWVPYGAGLPDVTVYQIEIDYCANKIRAATYGRDIWESDPYQPFNVPPVANAIYLSTEVNCMDSIIFTDQSEFNPTAWQWYFPGGQPASANVQNPVVIYPDGGLYTATLVASNSFGSDTAQYNIHTNVCAGIDPLYEPSRIQVYPNPNKGNFTLSISGIDRGTVNLQLYNELGQVISQNNFNKDGDVLTKDFSFSNLAKGIYYWRLTGATASKVQKMIIDSQ